LLENMPGDTLVVHFGFGRVGISCRVTFRLRWKTSDDLLAHLTHTTCINRFSDCAPASKTFEIKNKNDVTDIKTCETFTGNIVIAASAPEVISLDGIRNIVDGNIDVKGVTKLRALSSESLQTVSSFTLNNLPELSTLNFPSLISFSTLKWFNLPTLQTSTIASGAFKGRIQEFTVSNTSLRSLDWFKWPVQSQLNITQNAYLHTFSIPNTEIGQASEYTISDNPSLETLDMKKIKTIDGKLTITGNQRIKGLSADALETVNGDVVLSGGFDNITMSALKDVEGTLGIASSGNIESLCKDLSSAPFTENVRCSYAPQVQLTEYTPTEDGDNPESTSDSDTDGDRGPNGGGGVSKEVQIGLAFSALVFTVLICVAAFFYFRRRSRAKVREIDHPLPSPKRACSDVDADSIELEPKELEDAGFQRTMWRSSRQELAAEVPYELDAGYGRSELSVARPESVALSPAGSTRSTRSSAPLIRHELSA
jgi:hypothetical protein